MKEASPLKVGTKCNDFMLLNQNNIMCSLGDKLGKHKYVLVYFYPRAMTPGCTVQACSLEKVRKNYIKKKIGILGVSGDEVDKLKKFSIKEKLNFDLLSDVDHSVAIQFGVWGKKTFMGKIKEGIHRVSFIIDKNFKIVHVFEKVNTKTHHLDVLDFLELEINE